MAATSNYTRSLDNIPNDISESFLPDSENLSQRALTRGLNYYTQGYIHDIRIYDSGSAVQISARCWRSMRKKEEPHKLNIELSEGRDGISESFCSCKVGLSGRCSHIVGLIKSLKGFKLHNFKSVPDQQSCTSIPQQWHVPRGPKIQPVSISGGVVAKPSENRKRKPVLCQLDTNYKLPQIDTTDVTRLQQTAGTPLQYVLSNGHPLVETYFGKVQVGSVLSYQAKNTTPVAPVNSNGCGDLCVNKKPPVQLDKEFQDLNIGYLVVDPENMEKTTQKQSGCTEWFSARENRLTASAFSEVINRKSAPTDKFLSRLFTNISANISAPSLTYGKRNECKAKEQYLKKFPARHIHECGFVVANNFAFLGATPDGKVCDNGQSGIVEIKCPYTARCLTISEACDQLKDFCLKKDKDDISLKENHPYHIQVQGQLMITGCDFCDFIVYTPKDLFVQRIFPHIETIKLILRKLAIFFRDYAVPFLQEKNK